MMKRGTTLAATTAALALPSSATYSVIAYDEQSGCVAAAIASCTAFALDTPFRDSVIDMTTTLAGQTGKGVSVAQGSIEDPAKLQLIQQRISEGVSPAAAIAEATASDSSASFRQYGACSLTTRNCESYSGSDVGNFCQTQTDFWSGHYGQSRNLPLCMDGVQSTYTSGSVAAAFQGSVVTNDVMNRMQQSFASTEGMWIGDRVMSALEFVSADGVNGDARCRNPDWTTDTTRRGADQAALLLSCSCGNSQDISVGLADTREEDAAVVLRQQYDAVAGNLRCTANPTAIPTAVPTAAPTAIPTAVPTAIPTAVPTATPTATPFVPCEMTCDGRPAGFYTIAGLPNVYCDGNGCALIQNYAATCATHNQIGSVGTSSCGYLPQFYVQTLAMYSQSVILRDTNRGEAQSVAADVIAALQTNSNWYAVPQSSWQTNSGALWRFDATQCPAAENFAASAQWPNVFHGCNCAGCVHWLSNGQHLPSRDSGFPTTGSQTCLMMSATNGECSAAPTAIPTAIPTAVPTAVPTAIPTAVPTAIPTDEPTPAPTPKVTIPVRH